MTHFCVRNSHVYGEKIICRYLTKFEIAYVCVYSVLLYQLYNTEELPLTIDFYDKCREREQLTNK